MEKNAHNIETLRSSLLDNYDKLLDGTLQPKIAKETNNTAGKVINTVKIQMDYNHDHKIDKKIAFMEVE